MKDNTQKNEDSGTTLVTAGTGRIGRRIADRLKGRGVRVRTASRSGRPAFDWDDASTWDAALDGVDSVYMAYLPDLVVPGAEDVIRDFVAQAVALGVRRFVLLSGRGEEEGYACEDIVKTAGVDWTILRVSWFMQNFSEGDFLPMIKEGLIAVPARDIPEPFVDVNDIADVAVAALTDDTHAGEIYEVTGPRAITFAELANEISAATGRDVTFVKVPSEDFSRALTTAGAPEIIVWLMSYLFETVLDGRNAGVGDGVQRALGREPADFRDFARRIAARGTWNRTSQAAA